MEINENVRGEDVFVIQPTCPPVNDHLMELLVMIDAFKRASARRITAVMPYYGYAARTARCRRACRSPPSWWPTCSPPRGASALLAMDLHAGQIQGFFNIPVDNLFALPPVIVEYLVKKELHDPVRGLARRGRRGARPRFAKRLKAGLAIIDKRRDGNNVAESCTSSAT